MPRVLPILMLLPLLTGCVGTRHVVVDCVWVSREPVLAGGLARTTVSLTPDTADRRIRVAVVEDASLGTGRAWRASVWMAAFQAAMATGEELSDWLITVDVRTDGHGIDGPSAGGLLTAAMMAGLTGAKARPGFTMTGTVNPDGTIGPVNGIPQKFRAAVAAGKRRLGYPVGQGEAKDLETGRSVNLVETFSNGDTEVVEVTDIEQAYALLTGRPVARAPAVPADAMALPPTIRVAMAAQVDAWLVEAEALASEYRKLAYRHRGIDAEWRQVATQTSRAREDLAAGRTAAAYWRAVHVAVSARVAERTGRLLALAEERRYTEAVAHLETVRAVEDGRKARALRALRAARPRDATDLMTLVDAHEAGLSSLRSREQAAGRLKGASAGLSAVAADLASGRLRPGDADAGESLLLAIGAINELVLTGVNAQVATHNLLFREAARGGLVSDGRIARANAALATAARANLAYFEATSPGGAAYKDRSYQSARTVPRLVAGPMRAALGPGSGTAAHISRLAGALSIYISASMLITKHYSARVTVDEHGRVVGIGRQRSFDAMLDLAERKAREFAARAREQAGHIPAASRIAYGIAMAYRARGGLADRIQALEQFWRSSLFSRLVLSLGRGAR